MGGQHEAETVDDVLATRAENAVSGSAHAKIGDVSRAPWQDLLVRRGNVGVGAEHHVDSAVEIIPQSQLFAGGLGVDIQNRQIVVAFFPLENAIHRIKGAGERLQINSSRHVDAKQTEAFDLCDHVSRAGCLRRIVGGADDPLLVLQDRIDIPHAKAMVAKGDDVDTGIQKGVGVTGAKPLDLGGVLAVRDDKIDFFSVSDLPQVLLQVVDRGISYNVSQRQYAHTKSSILIGLLYLITFLYKCQDKKGSPQGEIFLAEKSQSVGHIT